MYKLCFWLLRLCHWRHFVLNLRRWSISVWNGGDGISFMYRLFIWYLRFRDGVNFVLELQCGYLFRINCHSMHQLRCRQI